MHRSSKRLASIIACAAVPVMLVAGCSDSGSKDSSDASKSATPSTSGTTSPSVSPAKFKTLPDPCKAFSQGTMKDLLPKVKDASGEKGKSTDTDASGTCSWYSSKSEGVDGSQFRWLDVGFKRYDSETSVGATGEKRAAGFYTKQVDLAKGTKDAKNVKTAAVDGVGDEATSVTYDIKNKGNDYKNQTIVARTANIVVTLNYNGAGLAGGDTPKRDDLLKAAQKAAGEAVNAAATANGAKAETPKADAGKSTAPEADDSKAKDTKDDKSKDAKGKDDKSDG
ncbi:DUF3558 family protein [Streptomyces pinistramenti]|uniref:DUF3558 family protein n=1 Tax=Streptomyces pinistramenti TaxID=2884812 RepID=UPI001D06A07B|nr:DUF3558 family protein [Streptomyces pinistramenti]MCB5911377.1 DUF3558 family protein [Streptomyces pinistramenti]